MIVIELCKYIYLYSLIERVDFLKKPLASEHDFKNFCENPVLAS